MGSVVRSPPNLQCLDCCLCFGQLPGTALLGLHLKFKVNMTTPTWYYQCKPVRSGPQPALFALAAPPYLTTRSSHVAAAARGGGGGGGGGGGRVFFTGIPG